MKKITFRNKFDTTYEVIVENEQCDKYIDILLRAFRDITVIDNDTGELIFQVYFDEDIFIKEIPEIVALGILTWR